VYYCEKCVELTALYHIIGGCTEIHAVCEEEFFFCNVNELGMCLSFGTVAGEMSVFWGMTPCSLNYGCQPLKELVAFVFRLVL
jgi:hypothetical protein